jgi:hypothetical protein
MQNALKKNNTKTRPSCEAIGEGGITNRKAMVPFLEAEFSSINECACERMFRRFAVVLSNWVCADLDRGSRQETTSESLFGVPPQIFARGSAG